MKILVTGFTGVQAHASRGQLGLISNLASIVGALEDSGHEVEWRAVTPGEPLDDYHKVIVSVNGVASWVAPFALGGLYCIGAREDAILTYDDWQGVSSFSSGNPEKELAVVWNPKLGRLHHDAAFNDPAIKGLIDDGVEELCYIHYRKVLLPLFKNHDISRLGLGAPNAVRYDPSSYMHIYDYAPDMEKARIWVYAGLTDKQKFFKVHTFNWEVEKYGVRRLSQTRMTEAELAGVYSQRWGVLSPPHGHVGSGWFRVRFLMAASAGAVVYCDKEEAASVGYRRHDTISEIENMSEHELKTLALEQFEDFNAGCWTKQELQEFMAKQVA